MQNSKQMYLNPRWEISKSQNEIDNKLNLNYEAIDHTKCTLPSSIVRS
jgi:hypothetical protein